MTSLKGTILGCITFLITVGVVITYFSQQDRYALYSQEKGIFVFDRKTATLNYCDAQTCQMIRPNIPMQESEVVMAGISGLPGQTAIVNGSIPVSAPAMVPQQQGIMRSSMATTPPMMMQQQPMTTMIQPVMPAQTVAAQPVAAAAPAAPAAAAPAKPAADKADKKDDSGDDDKSSDDAKDDSGDDDKSSDDAKGDDDAGADE